MSTKEMTTQISLMDLYKLGSHRGNSRSKLNPRLKKYIYGTKQGLSLIDLTQLHSSLDKAEALLENLGRRRKQVLFVGTSTHVQALAKSFADKTGAKGMPYISQRWLGGTLTNWSTIKKTLKRLEKNEKIIANEKFFKELSRNEQLALTRETEKLVNIFGGLRYLKTNRPGALIVLDAAENDVAIAEADLMNVPSIILANTSVTRIPAKTDYMIVCNNNSVKLVEMLADRFVSAYNRGLASTATEDSKQVEEKKAVK